jgi:hypothetical protein
VRARVFSFSSDAVVSADDAWRLHVSGSGSLGAFAWAG